MGVWLCGREGAEWLLAVCCPFLSSQSCVHAGQLQSLLLVADMLATVHACTQTLLSVYAAMQAGSVRVASTNTTLPQSLSHWPRHLSTLVAALSTSQ